MRFFILADNQDITRIGLKSILQGSAYTELVTEASALAQLQEMLVRYPRAVVVLDYTLFDFESVAQLLIVKAAYPESDWLLFSEELSAAFLRQVLHSDPWVSVVSKGSPLCEIATALEAVLVRENYLSEEVSELIRLNRIPAEPMVSLTKAEVSVLQQIAQGKTTKEIAFEKNLSFHTVNSHRKNLFRKLQVNNVQEAIKYAYRAGLIDLSDYTI